MVTFVEYSNPAGIADGSITSREQQQPWEDRDGGRLYPSLRTCSAERFHPGSVCKRGVHGHSSVQGKRSVHLQGIGGVGAAGIPHHGSSCARGLRIFNATEQKKERKEEQMGHYYFDSDSGTRPRCGWNEVYLHSFFWRGGGGEAGGWLRLMMSLSDLFSADFIVVRIIELLSLEVLV